MIVSFIKDVNYLYFNLHAEEVITSNYYKENNKGIYVSSLHFETVDRLYCFIKDFKLEEQQYIILDFKNLLFIQSNIISKIIDIRSLGFKIIFKNIIPEIFDSLSVNVITNEKNIRNVNNGYNTFYYFTSDSELIYTLEINEKDLFIKEFKRLLKEKEYITEYNEKHTSSFVYLYSFLDLKKFISIERPFIYFALYKLALKIKFNWEKELKNNPILVSQSLNSTFLVSVLSKFLNLDILVFDKIGPITKLYNKLEKHNFDKRKYIVVSDLVCLGTEVKITKSLIEFSGGEYLGNVSLVKIETLSRKDLELKNIDRTISIFSITRDNNEELNYYIYTNLKPMPKNE
jgi:hypothetical protein